jgi:hypothetical protein
LLKSVKIISSLLNGHHQFIATKSNIDGLLNNFNTLLPSLKREEVGQRHKKTCLRFVSERQVFINRP